jgi:hypothetical protein
MSQSTHLVHPLELVDELRVDAEEAQVFAEEI